MALNKFPSYEELRKNSPEILGIIETPIAEGDIVRISGYPGTGKTLVSGMMFTHCSNKNKIYLTYANMLVAYTKQGLGASENIENFDYYITKKGCYCDKDMDLREKRIKRLESMPQQKGTILFLDEAQDIPSDLVAKLSLKFDSVVICGDKDQTIKENSNLGVDFFQEYEDDLRRNDPNFDSRYIFRDPGKLTKNYRNTAPIFEFARLFQPDSIRINDIQIMRQGGEKPQLRTGLQDDLLDELVTLCINSIENHEVIGIIPECTSDVNIIYNKLKDALRERMGFKFNDSIINEYTSENDKNNKDKQNNCNKCMNSNIIVASIQSMKGLEFDVVVLRKLGDSHGWANGPLNRNRYYVGMTRAKDRLIICQDNEDFGSYHIPNDLYELKKIAIGNHTKKSEGIFDDDEYDDLPF